MPEFIVFKVHRAGACPYCIGSFDLIVIETLREDRIAMQCSTCGDYSIRHSNGSQYPLEDRTDYKSDPAILIHYPNPE